jgi:hypothetical protein
MLDEALLLVDEVKAKYVKLLEYFGEDAKMASNDFFGTMRKFIKEFGTAANQVEKEEQAKVRMNLVLRMCATDEIPIAYCSSQLDF